MVTESDFAVQSALVRILLVYTANLKNTTVSYIEPTSRCSQVKCLSYYCIAVEHFFTTEAVYEFL